MDVYDRLGLHTAVERDEFYLGLWQRHYGEGVRQVNLIEQYGIKRNTMNARFKKIWRTVADRHQAGDTIHMLAAAFGVSEALLKARLGKSAVAATTTTDGSQSGTEPTSRDVTKRTTVHCRESSGDGDEPIPKRIRVAADKCAQVVTDVESSNSTHVIKSEQVTSQDGCSTSLAETSESQLNEPNAPEVVQDNKSQNEGFGEEGGGVYNETFQTSDGLGDFRAALKEHLSSICESLAERSEGWTDKERYDALKEVREIEMLQRPEEDFSSERQFQESRRELKAQLEQAKEEAELFLSESFEAITGIQHIELLSSLFDGVLDNALVSERTHNEHKANRQKLQDAVAQKLAGITAAVEKSMLTENTFVQILELLDRVGDEGNSYSKKFQQELVKYSNKKAIYTRLQELLVFMSAQYVEQDEKKAAIEYDQVRSDSERETEQLIREYLPSLMSVVSAFLQQKSCLLAKSAQQLTDLEQVMADDRKFGDKALEMRLSDYVEELRRVYNEQQDQVLTLLEKQQCLWYSRRNVLSTGVWQFVSSQFAELSKRCPETSCTDLPLIYKELATNEAQEKEEQSTLEPKAWYKFWQA